MSRTLINGVWVLVCDWKNEATGEICTLGIGNDGKPDGSPRMTIDPDAGTKSEKHFQCGRHHGVIPQKERPEFQLPKDHKLNEEVFRPGTEMEGTSTEEVEDGR